MLQTIRQKSRGPVLTFIIVSICLMFAVTGVDSILGSGSVDRVAKVNGEKVTGQELDEAIFLHKRQLIAKMGENLDPSMLEEKKLKQPALDTLIERKLLLQFAEEQKMGLADSEISKMIMNNPDFQKDGKFSNDTFRAILAGAGLTPALYKRFYSNDVLLDQISSGIVETGFITDKDIAIDNRFTFQTRDLRYITLGLEDAKKSISVTDEETQQFYEKNPDKFQSDESAIVEYIEIKQDDFKPDISEEEIKEAYEEEVAAFKPDEQREVSHILIEVDEETSKEQATAKLVQIQKQLQEGQEFSDLAIAYSEDLGSKDSGGMLGVLNEESFPKEFVTAAKVLNKGEVSGIVETESGLHLIQLSEINKPEMATYESRKDAILADLTLAKATPMYLQAVEQLKDIAFNSADLSEPAKSLNEEIQVSAAVTRKGGEGIFGNKAVYTAVFNEPVLVNGENSEVLELGPNRAVVLRVKEHQPAGLIPFAEISEKVKAEAITAKAQEQLLAKADNIKAKILSGAEIEQLAIENGFSWQLSLAARRTAVDADPELINAAFAMPKTAGEIPAVDTIKKANGDFIVLAVNNVKDGNPTDITPMETKTIKSYVARAVSLEQFNAIENAIKSKADIKIYE
jgi:peptidyl-prolyl cis-trans isomerase D